MSVEVSQSKRMNTYHLPVAGPVSRPTIPPAAQGR